MGKWPMISQIKHYYLLGTNKCYKAEHQLSLYVDGQLFGSSAAELEQHLRECPSCRAAQTIMAATHQVMSSRTMAEPPAYLSERLRQAIAMEVSRPVSVNQRPTNLIPKIALAGAGFAAVAVLSLIAFRHPGELNRAASLSKPTETASNSGITTTPHLSVVHKHEASHRAQTFQMAESVVPYNESISAMGPNPQIDFRTIPNHVQVATIHWQMTSHHQVNDTVIMHSVVHVESIKPANLGPQVAVLPTNPLSAATSLGTTPSTSVAPQTPTNSGATTVADNTDQENRDSLYSRLRLAVLNSSTNADAFVQPDQSKIRVTSYIPPGVQIQGSKIDN